MGDAALGATVEASMRLRPNNHRYRCRVIYGLAASETFGQGYVGKDEAGDMQFPADCHYGEGYDILVVDGGVRKTARVLWERVVLVAAIGKDLRMRWFRLCAQQTPDGSSVTPRFREMFVHVTDADEFAAPPEATRRLIAFLADLPDPYVQEGYYEPELPSPFLGWEFD